jgi:hypothetical protein
VETLVQRLADYTATPFAPRDGEVPDADRPCARFSPTARWMLWVVVLILPGSFLLLPLLLWARLRARRRAAVVPSASGRNLDAQVLAEDAANVFD